ncbi:hypothetical protein V9K67_14425 [Paraflavisolibacter sp. H34]|uniref:hypothetical protein n=1 Tax=Huijunlia imazamoxiresistens TaxID=3127457 RepID=UPI00301B331F
MRLHIIRKTIAPFLFLFLSGAAARAQEKVSFQRFSNNPIISPALVGGTEGENINGPSLLKVPDWVPNRLGKYYLYFAHHKGKYIRLAYADDLKGPWKIYQPGTLQLKDCAPCADGLPRSGNSVKHEGAETGDDGVTHVASPDVLVDKANKQLVLYFHCPLEKGSYKGQYSFRATSKDGLHFTADTTVLGYSYFRVFPYKGQYYSLSRAGLLARSPDGITAFEEGHNPFSNIQNKNNYLRHAAVHLSGDTLYVFYSRIGDAPERIVVSKIPLNGDWTTWTATAPVDVVRPEKEYEGGNLPVAASQPGLYYGNVRQLRDPYLYEESGRLYLLYSVAGEAGIAIGEVKLK